MISRRKFEYFNVAHIIRERHTQHRTFSNHETFHNKTRVPNKKFWLLDISRQFSLFRDQDQNR